MSSVATVNHNFVAANYVWDVNETYQYCNAVYQKKETAKNVPAITLK